MTTPRPPRRPRNARLAGSHRRDGTGASHFPCVNPPPPGSPEQWIANIEALLDGPLFRHWNGEAEALFLTDARLALTALFRPPHQEDTQLRRLGTATSLHQISTERPASPTHFRDISSLLSETRQDTEYSKGMMTTD